MVIPRTSHTHMPLRVVHVGGQGFTYMVENLSLATGSETSTSGLAGTCCQKPKGHNSTFKGVRFLAEAKQLRKEDSEVSDKLPLQRKIKLVR